MDLRYPFRLYPLNSTNILTDYISSFYLNEVKKLSNKINTISVENTFVILIIGSLIDDIVDYQFSDKHQYQHLPRFIHNYLESSDKNIKIICIAPGNGKDKEIKPQFIELTKDEYKWRQKTINEFKSTTYPRLSYNFYNTLFPEYIEKDFAKINGKDVYFYKNGPTELRIPRLYFKNRHIRNIYESKLELGNNVYIKIKDDITIAQFLDIEYSLPTDSDKIFVDNFHSNLNNLINRLKENSGSMIILNYSVFRDNWIRTSPFYFFETLYNNFTKYKWSNVKILNYLYNDSSSNLFDINNEKTHSYEDKMTEMKIGRNSRIQINKIENINKKVKAYEINNKSIEYKKKLRKSKDIININEMQFRIKKVNDDGNCMFNSVLNQFHKCPISVKDARKIIISEIFSTDYIEPLLKEELLTRTEYFKLINEKGIDFAFDLHLYFMKEGPECENTEYLRDYYKLPLDVYYGGNYELSILSRMLNVNIRIINTNNNIIDFLQSYNTEFENIFIKFNENHYNIAILDDNYKLNCNINENITTIPYNFDNSYNKRIRKFIKPSNIYCL